MIIKTNYNTIAAEIYGVEYIAIPIFEDEKIEVYCIPSGNAADIKGTLYLPDDSYLVVVHDMDDCGSADDVYEKCEKILDNLFGEGYIEA